MDTVIEIWQRGTSTLIELSTSIFLSVLFILIVCIFIYILRKLFKKLGIKSKKFNFWFISIFNFLTFNVLKKMTNNEDLSKLNMSLYDAVDDGLNNDEDNKKFKEEIVKSARLTIPDSPLTKKENEEV